MKKRLRQIGLALITLLLGAGQSAHAEDLVLVAGATGGTGQKLVRELKNAGYRVRALVRNGEKARKILGDSVEYATGDVRQRGSLDTALQGVRFAISVVGASRKEAGNGPEFVDFQGVRNLAQAAAAAKLDRFVLVSSSGVTQKDHILNRMFDNVMLWKAKGEVAVRASGVPYTIIRPGGLRDAPGGQSGVRLEQGDQGTGFIARADVARACVAALAAPATRDRTFEMFSAPPPPPQDWNALFLKLLPDALPAGAKPAEATAK